jgi:hypothetical protein
VKKCLKGSPIIYDLHMREVKTHMSRKEAKVAQAEVSIVILRRLRWIRVERSSPLEFYQDAKGISNVDGKS